MADIQVANTDADLSDNTLITEENAYTITGLHTFSRSTNAPFACVSGAAVVAYLDADKLDGQEGSYYLAAANFTGTLAVNRGGTGAATFTDGGVLLGSGTSAITAMAVLADSEMIVGDGSGDPVAESGATLRTSIGVGTGDSPQFTGVNVGHASDTTVTRASSGDLNVEGNIVYRAGGTDVPVADGGTGVGTLTDGGVLLGSGTSAVTAMAVLSDGEMIVGDGSGDPVAESGATLRTSVGVGTGDSPQFTAIELGHASDTTIARASAGNVTIEGNAIYRAGGTDVAVADGGTGASSLTDGGVLLGSGTSAVTAMAVLADSEMIVGDGSTDPVAESGSTLRTSIGCDVATNITSGTMATARLGSGTASSGTYLRGDSSWASITSSSQPMVCEGRLTLTSGTPVTTGDVTGAGTIYFALYGGNRIALYTGAAWTTVTFAEMSIAASGGTASKPHDIFLDYNGGSPALALLAWTDDTNRATALTTQDGVYVKNGDTQQRYLGTVWLDGSKQAADSEQDRHVWNYYNRTVRALRRVESTNSWTYTTATYRQANGSTANSVNVLVGLNEDAVTMTLSCGAYNSSSGVATEAAIGLDSTSAPATNCIRNSVEISAANDYVAFFSNFSGLVGLGRHDIVWLERSGSSGTTTWLGDEGGTTIQSGMQGVIRA